MRDGFDIGRESVLAVGGDRAGGGEAFRPAEEKYAVEAPIGRGGMGEVLLVTDRDLRRQVAMKVALPEVVEVPEARLHFVAEAQATSQLEHPGIPPVHDIGLTKDGRLYFTMKLVRGRTLREVIHDLLLRRGEVVRQWTLHRLVTVLERIAETMHFAHERGVLHRDLKPENVMLGDHGEVHVMDWGLARAGDSAVEGERVETAHADAGFRTQTGALKGTLPYMSPEQASGQGLDRRTDVYAMGCLLYEALTLQPAFDPGTKDLLSKVFLGQFPPVETKNPRRPVPAPLAAVCRRAMAKERDARHPTAEEFRKDLRAWLDGTSERERRHGEAERLAAEGVAAAREYAARKEAVAAAEAAAEEQSTRFEPWQPVAEKRALLEARKRVEEATVEVALAFAGATNLLGAALLQEEDNAAARSALADLWRGRLEEAESRGERADAAHALTMVRRYDDGRLAAFVAGDGSLALRSEPSGAEVTLHRYEERDGVLVPGEARILGRTPLGPVDLPMGSYLCVLRRPGFRDVRYPVHVTRNRRWEGTVRLRTDAEIGEGFVYVPGGPFVYGEGKATRILDLPDFAIARYPVTFREYSEYLAALESEGGVEAALAHLPRSYDGAPRMERGADGVYRALPIVVEGKARERCLREHGEGFEAHVPVYGITWFDAVAYGEWRTETTGRGHRLPREEEREKAARGVDGRRFPWGDLEDATLGKCRDSRDEPTQIEPIGAFPTAESVYGMGDAAGNVWDWTDSWFDSRRSSRVARGGGWLNPPAFLRAAYRYWYSPPLRSANVGFRCARGL
jgi:serine/threonine-protein kinase